MATAKEKCFKEAWDKYKDTFDDNAEGTCVGDRTGVGKNFLGFRVFAAALTTRSTRLGSS